MGDEFLTHIRSFDAFNASFSSRFVKPSTASSVHVSSIDTSNSAWVLCNKRHKFKKCLGVLRVPDKERAENIKFA